MEQVIVQTPEKKYPILLAENFDGLREAVRQCGLWGRKLFIVTDSAVEPLYLEKVKAALGGAFSQIVSFTFDTGEKSKNLDTISSIYQALIENRFDRKGVIAALGGGVCGDMAGFAAATFLRGIKFIQIPTTLLAQVDSSVGGKTGVDFLGAKNMIGAFYQPELVYINSQTIRSLPDREFSAGMAEVIKYGYIVSKPFLEIIHNNRQKIWDRDSRVLLNTIAQCCRFKAAVVANDEKEQGVREILNFGHTMGHAIESLLDFKLLHGECVGLGMIAALSICEKKGLLPAGTVEQAKELLAFFKLPVQVEDSLHPEVVLERLKLDKKVKNNKISFVLLNGIGEAFSTTDVSEQEMKQALQALQ